MHFYDTAANSGDVGAAISAILITYGIFFGFLIFMLACEVKIFQKIGYKGWYALCPYFSSYLYYKAVWGDGWKFLLAWIPFYNIYLVIKTLIGLGKSFGRGVGFGIGLIFLQPIFLAILAFGSDEYVGNPYEA